MATTLRLVLGDQLNINHSWFAEVDDGVCYLMMEVRQETDYVSHHIQKVAAFFQSMRNFRDELVRRGHRVVYITLDDERNTQNLPENVTRVLARLECDAFSFMEPDEYRLDEQLKKLCSELDVGCSSVDSEHFLTSRKDLADHFGQKQYLMENFYRHIRVKHDFLVDETGRPEGGRWNYDKENRKSLPQGIEVVEPLLFSHDVSGIVDTITASGVTTIGILDPERLIWPTTRRESLELLDYFLAHFLPLFGRYQDAMDSGHWSLFHSRLSYSLNVKMISPREVVERAIDCYRGNGGVELSGVEGFVRQIIGWREFMRGVYWAKMPEYAAMNYFGHDRDLPQFYWSGKTKMNCLRHAITQSLEHAYAHHIQRLMVTGNFALLAGVHPDQVDRWYLGIYIDAIEWVEITNTRGMSQYADGGVFATKPYVSSANYINRMSNYCRSCHYRHDRKSGERSCPYNLLYWNFLLRHESLLRSNHRMRMMYSHVDRMTGKGRTALRREAEECLRAIDDL